jgi:hypothetical protein
MVLNRRCRSAASRPVEKKASAPLLPPAPLLLLPLLLLLVEKLSVSGAA